jgi:hypothetical protein
LEVEGTHRDVHGRDGWVEIIPRNGREILLKRL